MCPPRSAGNRIAVSMRGRQPAEGFEGAIGQRDSAAGALSLWVGRHDAIHDLALHRDGGGGGAAVYIGPLCADPLGRAQAGLDGEHHQRRVDRIELVSHGVDLPRGERLELGAPHGRVTTHVEQPELGDDGEALRGRGSRRARHIPEEASAIGYGRACPDGASRDRLPVRAPRPAGRSRARGVRTGAGPARDAAHAGARS